MASQRELRGRIKTAKNIQQITKAMKMVAAARLRRAQERMLAARPYANSVADVLKDIAGRQAVGAHPLLAPRQGSIDGTGPLRLVIFAADKGLCGSFNVNILRRATQIIRENQNKRKVTLTVVGRKARDFFRNFDLPMVSQYIHLGNHLAFGTAEAIAQEQMSAFLSGEVDEVVLLYTDFKSIISLKATATRLLPFSLEQLNLEGEWERPAGTAPTGASELSFEPDQSRVFDYLTPRAVSMQVWRALLESQASELAARMTAMDSATRNSKEMIQSLTLYANRLRQAGITKEIAELVGGAEALK